MKKFLSLILLIACLASTASALFSCGRDESDNSSGNGQGSTDSPGNESDGKDHEDMIDEYLPTATITDGYGGAKGIIVLMTDNDSGEFRTVELLDELYVKYGLVGGLGTVTKNLYTDSACTTPKADTVALWQEYLDTGRWKIVCHSMTHKTYCDEVNGRTIVNEEKLYNEIVHSAELLREQFPDQKVLTYAQIGNESSIGSSTDDYNLREAERELIAEYYIGGRFSNSGATDFDKLQWNNLPYALLSTKNLSSILSNIDKAATEGKYYMVYNHYVIEDELIDTVNQSSWTTLSNAETLCQRVAQHVASGKLWCAHFEDAVMYMREKETASITASYEGGTVKILLTDRMNDDVYNHELTLEVSVPEEWEAVRITQGDKVSYAMVRFKPAFGDDKYIALVNLLPDGGEATIAPCSVSEIPTE